MKAVIISATTNAKRAVPCLRSWGAVPTVLVMNNTTLTRDDFPEDWLYLTYPSYLGTVPAFRAGVDYALDHTDADLLICLHDDVEILQPDWLERTVRHFETHPACGLAGYSGAIGLGADDIYQTAYDPMQLARVGFRSNLVDAEVHGLRSLLAERVACCDGFSLILRREFAEGWTQENEPSTRQDRPWTYFEDHGIVHHAYDSLMGAYAARLGWETWYLPVRCRHLGGQTAVGDAGYQTWAQAQIPGGDHGFWEQSHRRGFELFRDVLPLRV